MKGRASPPMREERDMSNAADDFSLLVGPDVPTRNYAAGAIIFREGDRGNEFFVIKRGKVHISTGTGCSKRSARMRFLARWR